MLVLSRCSGSGQPARRKATTLATIGSWRGESLLDTGSDKTLLSDQAFASLLRDGVKFSPVLVYVKLAFGEPTQETALLAEVAVCALGVTRSIEVSHVPGTRTDTTLIGYDFCYDAGIVIDHQAGRAWQRDNPNVTFNLFELQTEDSLAVHTDTETQQKEKLYKENEKLERATAADNGQQQYKTQDTPKPHSEHAETAPGHSNHAKSNKKSLQTTDMRRVTFTDETTGEVSVFGGAEEQPPELADHEVQTQPAKELPQEDLPVEIDQLLEQYRDIFAKEGPPTQLGEHPIETSGRPIAVPPYRVAGKYLPEVQQQIKEMLCQGIIEPCNGPWSSPLVVVKKKDGSIRLCVDYRKLNGQTRGDKYPLPTIPELLRDVQPGPFISILDLQAGYWQVPVPVEDADKTGFTAPGGFYRFRRMPFGLKNAPATFQRLMDSLKRRMPEVRCFAYLDDLIVTSDNLEQHLHDLQTVLAAFRNFNLRANREKCRFAVKKVHYLGHVLSSKGIEADPGKVSAILLMQPPSDLAGVRRITQTFSWFRRFANQMSDTLRPITELTKKGVKFFWGPEQQQALDTAKKLITSAPILAIPDLDKPFCISSDASAYAVGAVLAQEQTDGVHPIEYASRLLTPAERNYSTTEREALAVLWALQKFRGFIESNLITVYTDHIALKWVLSATAPQGRLARWSLALQQYELAISYVPGDKNRLADLLSRPEVGRIEAKSFEACFGAADPEQLRRKQKQDPQIAEIMDTLENPDTHPVLLAAHAARGYLLSRGILWRYPPGEDDADPQLVVPQDMRDEVLRANHDHPMAGHGGNDRTLTRLRSRFYWRSMLKDVEAYVKSCLECQRYKAVTTPPKNALVQRPLSRRFETIAIDLVGPLPDSAKGNTHILVIEDLATRWVELFALVEADAETCCKYLVDEVCCRYGVPRKMISDNGVQFISELTQGVALAMGIEQTTIANYTPRSNPVERKNRDLRPLLSIGCAERHRDWCERLPTIRFALNTSICRSTGYTPAYLTYGSELRTPDHVRYDVRPIEEVVNLVPELLPSLRRMRETAREVLEFEDRSFEAVAETRPQNLPRFKPGDLVLLKTHVRSDKRQGVSRKLAARRDGPYRIIQRLGPNVFELGRTEDNESIGKFSATDMFEFTPRDEEDEPPAPVRPVRKRGRPRGSTASAKRGRQS